MATLNKAAFEAKYNDAGTGLFKTGQSRGIGSDDTRALVEDAADSVLFSADDILDEDDMASDSATKVPSQQSVKAYVDAEIAAAVGIAKSFVVACSDEVTPLTTGTAKITFRMPYAMTLTAVRASLTTAQASGSTFTVDINEGGTTILSTKITIDNTEKTSTTAATPPVISDTSLADDAEITIDIDQIGDGTATGLKVTFIG